MATFQWYVARLFIALSSMVTSPQFAAGLQPMSGGQNLVLSPYIRRGELAQGRRLSRVHELPDAPKLKSFSGFITVDEAFNSNLFFWFIPNTNKSVPIIVWFAGGPGSSTVGRTFTESGPFKIDTSQRISKKPFAWTEHYHLVAVDIPVGAGFSFTDSEAGYPTTDTQVAQSVATFLPQFFELFNEYQKSDLYVLGWSYSGKVATLVPKRIKNLSSVNFNFKGLIIPVGAINLISIFSNSEQYYNFGLLNTNELKDFAVKEAEARSLYNSGNYTEVAKRYYELPALIKKYIGSDAIDSLPWTRYPDDYDSVFPYLNRKDVRSAFHVNEPSVTVEANNAKVVNRLSGTLFKTVLPELAAVLEDHRVLLIGCNLDGIITKTEIIAEGLKWSGSDDFSVAERSLFLIKGQTRAYVRKARSLYTATIRNCGHDFAYDQPEVSLEVMRQFISGTL